MWAALVALAARFAIPVPGTDVPQSAQTLAVVLAGAFLGMRGGMLALLLYLVMGALGLPVFADGALGAAHLVGPTAGYLVGFVAAAGLVGASVERWGRHRTVAFAAAFVTGHAIILFLGWVRLALQVGGGGAWAVGVAPFLVGGVAKSVMGAALFAVYVYGADRRAADGSPGLFNNGVGR